MKKKSLLYLVFSLLFLFMAPPSSPNTSYSEGKIIDVRGVLHLTGSEPFPELILRTTETGEETDFILSKKFRQKYGKYINMEVELRGKVKIKVLERADHKFKLTQYYLINPVLLTVYQPAEVLP